jgi:hypothetical protein
MRMFAFLSLVAYIVVSPFKTRAAAEALADTFLNARFALALLIAGGRLSLALPHREEGVRDTELRLRGGLRAPTL